LIVSKKTEKRGPPLKNKWSHTFIIYIASHFWLQIKHDTIEVIISFVF